MAPLTGRDRTVDRDLVTCHEVGALFRDGNQNPRIIWCDGLQDRRIRFDSRLWLYQLGGLSHRLIKGRDRCGSG